MKRFPGRVDGVAVHPFASSLHLAEFQFPRETLAGPRKFTQINCTVIMQDDSSQLENCNCHNSCPSILAQIFALIIVTKVQVCVHLHFHCWQFIGGKHGEGGKAGGDGFSWREILNFFPTHFLFKSGQTATETCFVSAQAPHLTLARPS